MQNVFNRKNGKVVLAVVVVVAIMALIVLVAVGGYVLANVELRNATIDFAQGQDTSIVLK